MSPTYEEIHAEAQFVEKGSMYQYYKTLLSLRQQYPSLSRGDYTRLEQRQDAIIYTKRFAEEEAVVILQYGDKPLLVDLTEWSDMKMNLLIASGVGDEMDSGKFRLEIPAHTAVIFVSTNTR